MDHEIDYQKTFAGRWICATLFGFSGAVNGAACNYYFKWFSGPTDVVYIAVLGLVGGVATGLVAAGFVGRPGVKGWFLSLATAIVCTSIGGGIGGSVFFGLLGFMGGVFSIVGILTRMETALIWTASIAITHLLIRWISTRHSCRFVGP
ncbi:MAG: hypothetical protein ACI9JL_003228 [Paracoccaceae bacterium]|jgi:hypothetical protein